MAGRVTDRVISYSPLNHPSRKTAIGMVTAVAGSFLSQAREASWRMALVRAHTRFSAERAGAPGPRGR